MSPTVSIIVPVYNAEHTISRCIESILNQKYTDFELLLVNDGSTDRSGAICDAYAARDSRVRVIHKENSGVSDTRNTALNQAKGTYLQFLDSDDWITPDATSSLVRTAESGSCDLVVSDFYRVVGERVSQKGDIDDDGLMTREEYAAHMMENPADFYYGVLWNKLYRREIVEAHHLRMDPQISWCEDFMFNLEYIRYAETFRALQVPIYYYVKTKGSLANQSLTISKTVKMKLMVFEYYQQFFKTVIYMPNLIMASAFAMLFFTLFSDSATGPVNSILLTLGIIKEPIRWLTYVWGARSLVALMNFLMWFGNTTIILMSAIMGVDPGLYEAAQLDGCTSGQMFWKITMPLIRPLLIYTLITSVVGGLQMFDVPQILSNGQGSPNKSTTTIIMYLNQHLFSKNYGTAGALSVLLFLVCGVLCVMIYKLQSKED